MDQDEVIEGGEKEKVFSNAEIALVGMALLLADGLDLLSFGIPIGDIIAFPFLQIYLRVKGLKGSYGLAGNLLELIPAIDYLPLRTASFLVSAYIANTRPELMMLANLKKGAVEQGAKAGAAAAVENTASNLEKNIERKGQGLSNKTLSKTETSSGPILDTTEKEGYSGKVITEEDFGMPKDNPIDQTREDLFAEMNGPSRTWNRQNNPSSPFPWRDDSLKDERGDDLEERLDTGLYRLKEIADNSEVLDTMRDIPQERSSKDDGETIDLRKGT